MKKVLCAVLILSVAAGLLSGCGSGPDAEDLPPDENPLQAVEADTGAEAAGQESGVIELAEPDSIDDSYSFSFRQGGTALGDYMSETILPEYASRWLDGAEVLDSDIQADYTRDDMYIYGWVLLRGTPKTELGWRELEYEGEGAYCRWIDARAEDSGDTFQVKKSLAMLPVKKADIPKYGDEQRLSGLRAAQLYVRQLDRSFEISDPESLAKLEKGFTRKSYIDCYNGNRLAFDEFSNPLFLDFEDGSRMLVNTMGNGSCGADLWDGFCGFYSNVSLFELFGVPLEAEGYVHNEDGTTTVHTILTELEYKAADPKIIRSTAELDFGPGGDLLRVYRNFTQIKPLTKRYIYNDTGQIVKIEVSGGGSTEVDYDELSYDDRGNMTRITKFMSGKPFDSHEYIYDDRDRVTAVIYHNADGTEGLPSGNLYFWYDEADVCHQYGYDPTGEIHGEAPPGEGPVRRP
ncbi:MAG: hypothetical protein ACOX68_06120 [Candidatus Limivicinus sp.]|jgi:hypothetical protein